MNFTIETLPKSGTWTSVNGDFVFPFSWTEKLDKALDECQVVCYNSTVKRYKPNTPFRVTITDGTNSKTFYYKLARDDSTEYPNGSTNYKHTFNLIEATKYLEGVMCQTLTFTNTLGKGLEKGDSIMGTWLEGGSARTNIDAMGLVNTAVTTPVYTNTYTVVSARTACTEALERLNSALHTSYTLLQTYTGYNCVTGSTTKTTNDWNHSDTVTVQNDKVTITYSMHLKDGAYDEVWHFTVEVYRINETYRNKATKKWTIADVCNRMFNLAEPIFSADTPSTSTPRFYLSQKDTEELSQILSPEFTISQSTLREQLQLVGGYIHAEPRVTAMSATGGKYRYEISFDYYSKLSKATVPAHLKSTHSYDITAYATRIHTDARNIVNTVSSGTVITDPAIDTFKGVRAEQTNVRISESNAVVNTYEPIYELEKVKCGIFTSGETSQYQTVPLFPVDITTFCYEATEYDSVLSTFSNQYPTKAYALRWERGQKNITGLYYQAPHFWSQALSPYTIANILSTMTGKTASEIETLIGTTGNQLVFQVTYKPVTNTAFIHGKNEYSDDEPYTLAYNQSDSLIEQTYYGQNIKGTAQRTGNPELQQTFSFSSLAYLPHIGNLVQIGSEEYFVTVANYQMDSQRILGTLSFTQDYNRISEYIGVNSQKRISEISTDQSYDRNIVIPINLILGRMPSGHTPTSGINFDVASEFSKVFNFPTGTYNEVSQAYLDINGGNKTLLPAVASGYGNVTVLTTSMKDNYSAGESEHYYSGADEITGYWQEDYRFGDYFGRAKSINIKFFDYAITAPYLRRNFAFDYPNYGNVRYTAENTPKVSTPTPLYVAKDSRERLAIITVAMEVKSDIKGVTIGSAFSKYNGLVASSKTRGFAVPHLYIVPKDLGTFTYEMPYKLDTDIIDYDRTDWTDEGVVRAEYSEGDDHFALYVYTDDTYTERVENASADGKGFVIAYPVTTETISVVDDSGQTVQQTINKGGEIVLIKSYEVRSGDTLLGTNYTFYKE